MIDTHCHFDLTENPFEFIQNNERNKIITIGMTNLPSHFKLGINHLKDYKYIRLSLGLHPLLANNHKEEYELFTQMLNLTSYIGEVGLDFSRDGIMTKQIQINSFDFVLNSLENKKKILSIHSRSAEKEVLNMLINHKTSNAIFHWYSGDLSTIKTIIDNKYYFSINSAMTNSDKGRKLISLIPRNLILTETDSPFILNSNINDVYSYLSTIWKLSNKEAEEVIKINFNQLIKSII